MIANKENFHAFNSIFEKLMEELSEEELKELEGVLANMISDSEEKRTGESAVIVKRLWPSEVREIIADPTLKLDAWDMDEIAEKANEGIHSMGGFQQMLKIILGNMF